MEGPAVQHHLDAVPIGRIVAAGDHQAGIGVHFKHAEIQHRRGAKADIDHIAAGRHQPARNGVGQAAAAHAAIAAQADARISGAAASAAQHGAKAAANGSGVVLGQGVAHDAANIVGAQQAGMEVVASHQALSPLNRGAFRPP